MRAVHASRSVVIGAAALLALTLVACGGRSPTVGPAASPTPSPPAAQTVSPAPNPTATAQPTRGCPAGGVEPELSLFVRTAQGSLTLELLPGPMPSPIAVDKSIVPIETTVVGGTQASAELQDDLGVLDAVFSSVVADFLPYGSTTPEPLAASIVGSTVRVTLLDRAVAGQLRIAVAWSSACGSGDGAGSVGLTIVPSSSVAGCPTTDAGLIESLAELGTARITIGTLALPVQIYGWSGRWIQANGTDDFPEFAGWDQGTSVSVAPEANVNVRESVEDLGLLSIRASIFHRADVLAYLEPDFGGNLSAVTTITRNVNAFGRANIPAPAEPGSYVFELQSSWQTSCLALETYHVVSVEVR